MKDINELDLESGIIDAADRVVQEILKTPKIKSAIKIIINALDPKSAPGLVRTLMWQDAEIFMDAIGAVPKIFNAMIFGFKEMLVQMPKYPPPVLAGFIAHIFDSIDAEALGSAISEIPGFHTAMKSAPGDPVRKSMTDFSRRITEGIKNEGESPASLLLSFLQPFISQQIRLLSEEAGKEGSQTREIIKGLSEALTQSINDNPDFLTYVCKPIADSFNQAASEDE